MPLPTGTNLVTVKIVISGPSLTFHVEREFVSMDSYTSEMELILKSIGVIADVVKKDFAKYVDDSKRPRVIEFDKGTS
jgi:hypothetical protein